MSSVHHWQNLEQYPHGMQTVHHQTGQSSHYKRVFNNSIAMFRRRFDHNNVIRPSAIARSRLLAGNTYMGQEIHKKWRPSYSREEDEKEQLLE